jgi:lysophospholipase L1-like esterase
MLRARLIAERSPLDPLPAPVPPRGRIAASIGGVALLVGTLLLLAGAGELALRLVPGWSSDPALGRFNPYRPDGRTGYALRPGASVLHEEEEFSVPVRVNALGQRGPERTAAKPPGVRRILVLGDSFASGFGVREEEAFFSVLERLLSERGERVEVLSAGVPGWSADNHLVFLRTVGFDLDPDVVLLAVCENDLNDLAWNRLTLDDERLPVRVEATRRMIDQRGRMRYVNEGRVALPSFAFPGQDWLADHSFLYHFLRFRLTKLEAALALRDDTPPFPAWLKADPERPLGELSQGEIQLALGASPDFRLRYHRHLVSAIARACAERGVEFRVLLVALRDGARDRDPTLEALHADCASEPAVCLDSAHVIAANGTDPAAFFDHDPHWNARGHAQVGEALAAWLGAGAR